MKKFTSTGAVLFAVLLAQAAPAESQRMTSGIEQLMSQASEAIDAGRSIQAVQLLTKLIGLPEHAYSAQAQEMLGNLREANGQLAHAVAEYRIYLAKYPEGEGASRVQARLAALEGSGPARQPAPPIATAAAPTPAASAPRRAGGTARTPAPVAAEAAGMGPEFTIKDRGRVSLTYRHNEGASQVTDLTPDPDEPGDEEEFFDDTVTSALWFTRIYENDAKRVTLTFSSSTDIDLDATSDINLRLYEASAAFEDKSSGRVLTLGRQRLDISSIAYRADGVSLKYPTDNGPDFGFVLGSVVDSSRDAPFEGDRYFLAASATWEGLWGQDELTVYGVEQRADGHTDRRALGAEYEVKFDGGSVHANAEYDVMLRELNRVLVTGTLVLPNDARLTGRASFYHSPGLRLSNALIGQPVDTIDELLATPFTQDEIEQLALDRSAEVSTLGLNYYGKLNDKWSMAIDGALYHTSGTPASGGVAAVAAEGVRSYFGVSVYGSSIFQDRDQLRFGLRHSHSDDSDLLVFNTSLRFPVSDDLTIQPKLQIGYRDFVGAGGTEQFFIPSINAQYRINRDTRLQIEAGGRWSETRTTLTTTDERELFLTAGISRSF